MTASDLIIGLAATIIASGFLGLWKHSSDNRKAIAGLELDIAKNYSSKKDLEKIETSVHELAQEMKSVLEILYELRADIRAGNISER